MIWIKEHYVVLVLFFINIESARSSHEMELPHKHPMDITNSPYRSELSEIASIFSPRMNFDQWKPLTGRGDPLRNDPTYDYEPPVLERVHYWVDDSKLEREKQPERKSEVLVLGVSSRKPSVALRSPLPIKGHPRPPSFAMKYEDFSYKFSDHYPMTILVPPPPPPPTSYEHSFIHSHSQDQLITPMTAPISDPTRETTITPEVITTYAVQEANLIYHSSTLKQNWIDYNKTTNLHNNTVSSDYAGWGPTTPLEEVNEAHNIISHTDNHNFEFNREPHSYYKPVLSEAPPPPLSHQDSLNTVHFLPTVLPPTSIASETQETTYLAETTLQKTTQSPNDYMKSSNEKKGTSSYHSTSLPLPNLNIIGMLGPMISMPMVTDPNRPEDNLYAHASDNIHVYKDPPSEDTANINAMQTMQPPPPGISTQSTTLYRAHNFHVNPDHLNSLLNENPTHDPYLHLRYTTPVNVKILESQDMTTESQSIPKYLIIQGHSKVKTYGSKPKPISIVSNDIVSQFETNEVKHLHPIKEKLGNMSEETVKTRESRSKNLKSLVETGTGSIEIQEADLGIKYDVSDGSDVPVELYRKGIIETDENNYPNTKKFQT